MADTTKVGKWTGEDATAPAAGRRRAVPLPNGICRLGGLLMVLLWFSLLGRDCRAQEGRINREHVIKAAYLANFLRYVDWPKGAEDTQHPPIIGVAGRHPIVFYLQQAAQQGGDDSFRVELVEGEVVPDGCRILFLPSSLSPDLRQKLLRAAENAPVLTVGDNLDFLQEGGEVRFAIEDNKIRVEMALRPIEAKGLKVSSKLLQVARVVDADARLSQGTR